DYAKEIEAKGLLGASNKNRTYMFSAYLSLLPFNLGSHLYAFLSSFVYIQSLIFLVLSCTILFLIRNSRYFFQFLFGVCINPLILIYIPLPLSESLVCLVVFVLIAIIVNIDRIKPSVFLVLIGTIAGSLVVIRPASISVSTGLIVFCLLYIWKRYRDSRQASANKTLLASLMVLCLCVSFLIPISIQYYINYKHYNALKMVGNMDLGGYQLKGGIELYKYGTFLIPVNNWVGVRYKSGITPPEDKRYLLFYLQHPLKGMKLAFIHVYSALNYDFLEPYVHSMYKRISFHQILSSLITILGFLGMGYYWIENINKRQMPLNLYALGDMLVLFSIPLLMVVAAETRFGLIPMIFLSVRTVGFLFDLKNMKIRSILFVLLVVVLYVVASIYLSDHIFSKAKI
ncbi:hypothetical protein ACFL4R_00995, partial [Nitrospirota bacterium]